MIDVLHLTTVHPRTDVRIFVKQCRSLAQHFARETYLVVADSLGDAIVDDVHIVDIGRPGGGRLGRMLLGSWGALRTVLRLRPKVVHFHDPELLLMALLLRAMGFKVIYDVHEDVPRQILAKHWLPVGIRQLVSTIMSGLEWLSGRMLTGIVAATPTIAERFPAEKTITVQNFPMISELATQEIVPQAERGVFVVYIGVIATIRGAVEMVSALNRLPATERMRLHVAGAFSPPQLRGELEALPGWARMEYLGWLGRNEVADLLAQGRAGLVVLHPTKNYPDAYPVKMFEYMAAGLPVIASDFPLWRSIVDGAQCGVLVDPLDTQAIADAISWIAAHPDEADMMGRCGRDAVLQRYNWSQESRKLFDFYEKLIRN